MRLPARRPALVSRNLSLAYGVLLAVACASGFGWELWSAVLGLVSLGVGLALGVRLWVSVGFGSFALSAAILGSGDAPIEVVLAVVLLAVLSWDAGQRAIDVGAQLGRDANTSRVELLHAGSSAVVGVTTTAVGYSVYAFAGGGRPFATVTSLLVVVAGFTLWSTR